MGNYCLLRRLAKVALGLNYGQRQGRCILAMTLTTTLALVVPARATTWQIQADGQGDAPTVQAGIDSAVAGDTVLVSPGTYNEDLDFVGKNLVLRSQLGPEVTILDGTGQDSSVVVFRSGESRSAVLEGFTITNGEGTFYAGEGDPKYGGGLFCKRGSPTVRGNKFLRNHAAWGGGAWAGIQNMIYQPWELPEPLFEGNVFEENLAERGGGGLLIDASRAFVVGNKFIRNAIRLEGDGGGIRIDMRFFPAFVWVEQNEFYDNVATDQGGGLYAYMTPDAEGVDIRGNLFVRNQAQGIGPSSDSYGSGGGIGVSEVIGTIANNTIVSNIGNPDLPCGGGGIRLDATTSSLSVTNNIIAGNTNCAVTCRHNGTAQFGTNLLWNNTGTSLDSCPQGWSNSVIQADPQFCGQGVDDYTVAASSPALTGGSTLGAFSTPGCGPVSVNVTTWGLLKNLYHGRR